MLNLFCLRVVGFGKLLVERSAYAAVFTWHKFCQRCGVLARSPPGSGAILSVEGTFSTAAGVHGPCLQPRRGRRAFLGRLFLGNTPAFFWQARHPTTACRQGPIQTQQQPSAGSGLHPDGREHASTLPWHSRQSQIWPCLHFLRKVKSCVMSVPESIGSRSRLIWP